MRLAAAPLGALLPRLDPESGWVAICSSSALAAPPREWPHYVAAKGALEGLAAWVGAAHPRLRTVVVRPPRMLTAMTSTPSGRIDAADSDEVALWTVQRLAAEPLAPGLTVLEPAIREAVSSMSSVPVDRADVWEALSAYSDSYTCYSSALATWAALGEDGAAVAAAHQRRSVAGPGP